MSIEHRALKIWKVIFLVMAAVCLGAQADPLVMPLKTYQFERDLLGNSATLTQFRSNLVVETRRTINLWDIAPPTGTTNDVATLKTALGMLSPTSGGVIYVGEGTWAFCNVITQQNVTIRGMSHMNDNAGSPALTNYFKPATNGLPVIQIGDDSRYVKGFALEDATLMGASVGAIGVYFAGGAFECSVDNVTVSFFTNCWKFQGGVTYPCSIIHLNRVFGQPADVANSHVFYMLQTANYPTSWTTEISINNAHGDGPANNGHYLEADSVEFKSVNSYSDVRHLHGWVLSHNFTPVPWADLINVNIDGGNATNVVFESYSTNRFFADQASGFNIQMNGKWKTSDGTLLTPPPTILRQNSSALYLNVFRTLNLIKSGEADFAGGDYTNVQVYADAAGNLQLKAEAKAQFTTGSGLIQIDSAPSTAVSTLRLRDTLNSRSADILTSAGDIEIWPASGSAGVKIMDASVTVRVQVNASGAIFLTGTGLGANTSGLYLDSNSQLKSVAGATATLDFPSTSAQSSSDLTVTVTGAAVGDGAVVGPPASVNANTSFTAWVSAADTVTVRFNNYSSGAVDPASGSYKVKVLK